MTINEVQAGPRKVSRMADVDIPADELFDLLADPRRHGEVDGSGTVKDAVSAPPRLSSGAKFSVNMKQLGLPYRITSRVTEFVDGRVLEWRHPMGHRWRWELTPTGQSTRVTETFDYSRVPAPIAKVLQLTGMVRHNAAGIEATLRGLQARPPRG